MTTDRVLAVFAHPDDESLLAGGTLAACAASGAEVHLLCLTRGELGPISSPELALPENLAAVRERELQLAGEALGARTATCLKYPDGELPSQDYRLVAADLASRMEEVGATVVVTFGAEGLYWHPDHMAAHELTLKAARILPDGQEPWVYGATFPRSLMEDLVRRLADRGEPTSLWGLNPLDFGVPREDISLTLDIRRFLPNKLRALRSHRTQIGPEHLLWGIPDDLASEFLGDEYFIKIWPKHGDRDLLSAVAGLESEILYAG